MAPANQDNVKCGEHSEAISGLKVSDGRQWAIIDRLQNRLPTWAVIVISVLTFLLGFVSGVKVPFNPAGKADSSIAWPRVQPDRLYQSGQAAFAEPAQSYAVSE